jgi:hypothetical protein
MPTSTGRRSVLRATRAVPVGEGAFGSEEVRVVCGSNRAVDRPRIAGYAGERRTPECKGLMGLLERIRTGSTALSEPRHRRRTPCLNRLCLFDLFWAGTANAPASVRRGPALALTRQATLSFAAEGRVNISGGSGGGEGRAYDLQDGGRLLACDMWLGGFGRQDHLEWRLLMDTDRSSGRHKLSCNCDSVGRWITPLDRFQDLHCGRSCCAKKDPPGCHRPFSGRQVLIQLERAKRAIVPCAVQG